MAYLQAYFTCLGLYSDYLEVVYYTLLEPLLIGFLPVQGLFGLFQTGFWPIWGLFRHLFGLDFGLFCAYFGHVQTGFCLFGTVQDALPVSLHSMKDRTSMWIFTRLQFGFIPYLYPFIQLINSVLLSQEHLL